MGKLKRQIIFIALLFVFIDFAFWFSIDFYYHARKRQILNQWTDMEMIIVKEAARASKAWLNEKVVLEKNDSKLIEKEIFTTYIKPIQLLKNGDAWIYNRYHIIFDDSEDLPEEYIGRSIRDIFTIQAKNGAYHFEEVVEGVEEGTDGKGWYVWLPEKGKEYVAWTSIKVGEETWTIGLSTPEAEILENAGYNKHRVVENVGLVIITLLLFCLYVFIVYNKVRDNKQYVFLHKTSIYQTELIQEIQTKTIELTQKNIQLGKASRAKDEFLANMSHELRTPLNAIIGLSETLQENKTEPLNLEQNKKIQYIFDSGKHLLSIINDILDLAKSESGKIYIDENKVPVRSLCTSSVNVVEPLAEKKNTKISLLVDPQITYCWGDELRLKQVLVNLMGNAVKFAPPGSTIGLNVSIDQVQECIRFNVWDDGIGIDSSHMKKVFHPFIQVDSKLSRLYGGTGLGLTLAFRLVRLQGGSINLTTRESGGCSFEVNMPINKPSSTVCFLQKCEWKGVVYTESEEYLQRLQELTRDPLAPKLIFINRPFDPENTNLPSDADFVLIDTPMITEESLVMLRKIRGLIKNPDVVVIFSLSLIIPENTIQIQNISNTFYIIHPFTFAFLLKTISNIVSQSKTEENM